MWWCGPCYTAIHISPVLPPGRSVTCCQSRVHNILWKHKTINLPWRCSTSWWWWWMVSDLPVLNIWSYSIYCSLGAKGWYIKNSINIVPCLKIIKPLLKTFMLSKELPPYLWLNKEYICKTIKKMVWKSDPEPHIYPHFIANPFGVGFYVVIMFILCPQVLSKPCGNGSNLSTLVVLVN